MHGSALFTRGETQILSSATLGTTRMDMKVDNLGLQEKKTFWHHYNFPPFSVGEAGFMRGPKRRDIGHGALAERALAATIPDEEEFPYVIRVVSDTLESNGSSSMGSVCASSMALQAAGVPVSAPVAGVAMGLIKEGDDYIVLTDIAGVEDHLGDMDFKVAGTEDGITALQMDIKITGVTFEILTDALEQARKGRLFILGKMAEAIDGPREKLSPYAPAIESIKIDPEKIGAVIGKGGETIRGMQEEFEAEIDIDDDGTVRVYAPSGAQVDGVIKRIESMTREAEVGDHFPNGARSSRRPRSARSSSSSRAPTACCTSPTSSPASGSRRSRACSARATRSTSPWPRSTRSAAASACVSPTTRRSPARAPRSCRSSARATRRWAAAVAVAATAATAAVAVAVIAADAADATAAVAVVSASASTDWSRRTSQRASSSPRSTRASES